MNKNTEGSSPSNIDELTKEIQSENIVSLQKRISDIRRRVVGVGGTLRELGIEIQKLNVDLFEVYAWTEGNSPRHHRSVGFAQGVVYAVAYHIRNGDTDHAEYLWKETGFTQDDVSECDEYDVAELRKYKFFE